MKYGEIIEVGTEISLCVLVMSHILKVSFSQNKNIIEGGQGCVVLI